MKTIFEKPYATPSANYLIKVTKMNLPTKKRAKAELFSDWSRFPIWSRVYDLANLESIADKMFAEYTEHVADEIAMELVNRKINQ